MANTRVAGLARLLADARRAGARIELAEPPKDFEEGFAVQDAVIGLLGEPVIGWKVIEVPGGPVVFAPLLASGLVPQGGTWAPAGHEPAGIELEIAFRMARDVEIGASRADILDAVGSAHVVFELCQSRNAQIEGLPRHVGLADCILNTGIMVGSAIDGWQAKELRGVGGRLLVDGLEHGAGKSADPLRALEVLPNALVQRGKALRAGQVVITGSLIGMHWLTGERAIVGEIDGLGRVEGRVKAG